MRRDKKLLLAFLAILILVLGIIIYSKYDFKSKNKKKNVIEVYTDALSEENTKDDYKDLNKKEIMAFELVSDLEGNNFYEIIGDKEFYKNILFKEEYSKLEGITTFRGNNLRNSPSFGISKISKEQLSYKWTYKTSYSSWGGGAGWTGQPVIVKWNSEEIKYMNIKEEFKNLNLLVEVIYGSIDGKIYFTELNTGKQTREPINVGNPIKGSLSIDSRGIPMLYVGEGINETGTVGLNIYSLIDGSKLYEIDGIDNDAYRNWPAFDSSPLIFNKGDILIEAGENGLLYIVKLNTNYKKEKMELSISPEIIKYKYNMRNNINRLGIENSVAIYANLLYFADNIGDIYCIDMNKMKPIWRLEGFDDTDATLTLDIENNIPFIYCGDEVDIQGTNGTSTIRKINGLTGEVVWQEEFKCNSIVGDNPVNGGVLSTNVIGKNNISNMVIFNIARYEEINKGLLIAMDKKTGKTLWKVELENYCWSSPVDFYDKDGNGYIIQCDSMGNMFLIDGLNGEVLYNIKLDANVEASPAIYEDTIVVATRAGTVYAIEIE